MVIPWPGYIYVLSAANYRKFVCAGRWQVKAHRIVHENGCRADHDVEVMVTRDRQVPHQPGMDRSSVAGHDSDGTGAGGAQVSVVAQRTGFDPSMVGGVPEQVVTGGVDYCSLMPGLTVRSVGWLISGMPVSDSRRPVM